MINQIYFDNDNCLVHCDHHQFLNDFDYSFALEDGVYGLKINPCAWNLLNFSRNLVGDENVFMLTSSSNDYANTIDKLAQFKFGYDKIFSREKIDNVIWNMNFCPDYKGEYVNPNNVLIDNLYPRENKEKMRFAGISFDRYLKVDDYYGHRIEDFEEKVIEFLKERYEALS